MSVISTLELVLLPASKKAILMMGLLLCVLFSCGMETFPPGYFPFTTNPLYLQSTHSSINTD